VQGAATLAIVGGAADKGPQLEYAEVASFSHAFKRWKGPPEVYRART
jgi:hypothetical protein